VFQGRTGHKTDGVCIFWRRDKFQLLDQASLKYIDVMGKEGEDRVALRVCLAAKQHPGRRLTVGTTHLDYKRPHAQVQMGKLFRDFIKEGIRVARDAVIVCGDFNCEFHSAPVQGFLEGFWGRFEAVVPQTTPSKRRLYTSYMREPKHIDHMFYDSKFVNLVGMKPPSLSSSKIPHAEYPSDHQLIGGEFTFSKQEEEGDEIMSE
jgi:endonuclease/exonuclease/phosphatase family metal-dependent hydrolase